MASFGSSVDGGGGLVDEQKPSLFEVLAEQQLHGLLPPTLRYLLTVATQRHPRYLLRVLNSFDELYAAAMVAVEQHSLRTRGGTFTEHFYGLKRERVPVVGGDLVRTARAGVASFGGSSSSSRGGDGNDDGNPLRPPLWRNVAVAVAVPYLQRKLAEAYERDAPRARLGAAFQQLPANASWRDRLRHWARWFLRRVYPVLHAVYGAALLACQLAYLFDVTPYASPLLWLVRTRVRRMTAADYRAIDIAAKASSASSSASASASAPSSSSSSSLAQRVLGDGLSMALPASIFALKFLEWWHASDFAKQLSQRASAHLDLPTPVATGLPATATDTSTSSVAPPQPPAAAVSSGAAGRKGILKKEPWRRSAAAGESTSANHASDDDGNDGNDDEDDENEEALLSRTAPIAKSSLRPIFTVPAPADSALCPICTNAITTPTACQTGVVYCYVCIHKWVAGQHARQEAFLARKSGRGSIASRWETGQGRCAVTGRRVLGGTEGLRRLMV